MGKGRASLTGLVRAYLYHFVHVLKHKLKQLLDYPNKMLGCWLAACVAIITSEYFYVKWHFNYYFVPRIHLKYKPIRICYKVKPGPESSCLEDGNLEKNQDDFFSWSLILCPNMKCVFRILDLSEVPPTSTQASKTKMCLIHEIYTM